MEKEERCFRCGGHVKILTRDIKIREGIVLEAQPYYCCIECGDEFSTSEQVRQGEKELRERFIFERHVISTGRSLAITLPSDFTKFYHIHKGKNVKIIPTGLKSAELIFE